MKFIELLEQGETLEAMKEIKSKLDGLKSGALIDIAEKIEEKYSTKKEQEEVEDDKEEKEEDKEEEEEDEVNEATEIEVPDAKKIINKYDDAEKGIAEIEKANFEYKKKVYLYVSNLLKDIDKKDPEKTIKAAAEKYGKKKGKEGLDVFDTYSVVYKGFNKIGTVKNEKIVDIQNLYDYAKDLENFIN